MSLPVSRISASLSLLFGVSWILGACDSAGEDSASNEEPVGPSDSTPQEPMTPVGEAGSPAVVPSEPPNSSPTEGSGGVGGVPGVPVGGLGGQMGDAGQPVMPMPSADSGGVSGGSGDVPIGGGAGQAGSPAGGSDAGGVDPCVVPEFAEPTSLSQTGLYSDIAAGAFADGVRPFQPRFQLWSDGAEKARWVYIPPCSTIDTADPNYWNYPVGFKLWKEFSRLNEQGELVRVETRLIQKYTATKWFMKAFLWNEDQTDAVAIEGDGAETLVAVENARGTEHDIPGQKACDGCHFNMLDKALGFSALQLDRDDAPEGFVTLATLEGEGLLSAPVARPITLPGTDVDVAALGYMHANCGHCHNPWSKQSSLNLQFWLELDTLGSVETTETFVTTVGLTSQVPQPPAGQPEFRIVPGDLEGSSVHWRMVQPPVYPAMPEGGVHMPLIGTEVTDEAGVQAIADWIASLPE
jgi:hypothetical protein